MQNDIATLEDDLTVSDKMKYNLTFRSSNQTPYYSPKGTENLCPHNKLEVYKNFIHNFQNLEATKVPFSRFMGNRLCCMQTME